MSFWKTFLEYIDHLKGIDTEPRPGRILFCFVNRYLEPMEAIRYKIVFDGKTVAGVTTKEAHSVEIEPASLSSVKVYAWSRVKRDFKLIDEVNPVIGKRLLVNERMKTYKHPSKTHPHPDPQPALPASKPAPAQPQEKRLPKGGEEHQGVDRIDTDNAQGEPEHQTNRPVTDKITVLQLKKIFPAAQESFLTKVAEELNVDLAKYKLDTPLRRAHFFAQVRQEAGSGLSPKQENLNYKPEVLVSKFSYYADHPKEAESDGRAEEEIMVEKTVKGIKKKVKMKRIIHAANQQTIANKAYASRPGSRNGPASSGDGWRFRGRGIFQLTFRANYEDFTAEYPTYWGKAPVNFAVDPDKACEFPYFIRSAVWYWIKNKVYTKADVGSTDAAVNACTRLINGKGMDAAAERRNNFHELTYPAFK